MSVNRTIGTTGANHVDVNAWVAYVQANVVSGGNLTDDVEGRVLAVGVTSSTQQIISGWAPGGSNFSTTLCANPGDGIADNPNKNTNALGYNTANGAFYASTYSASTGMITIRVNKSRVRGLQMKATGGYTRCLRYDTTAITDMQVDGNILWATSCDGGLVDIQSNVDGTACFIRNNVMRGDRGAGGSNGIGLAGGSTTFANRMRIYDNTIWINAGNSCIQGGSGGYIEIIGNVAIIAGGPCAISSRDGQTNGSNNATDNAAFNNTGYGGGSLTNITASQLSINLGNEFVAATGSNPTDFRLKAGGTQLQGTGTAISGVTGDIVGNTRPQGSVEDIGAYERPVAGGGAAGSMVGAAVVAGVGKTIKGAAGSLPGAATTNFVGRSLASVAGTCAGAAVVASTGKTQRLSAGTAAGAAVVAGAALTLRRTAATCAGASNATGVTNNMQAAAGTCAGAAVVAGVGKTIKPSAAACLGAAVVFGDARAMGRMAGTCAGNSSCNGVTSGSVAPAAGTCAGAAVVAAFGARRVAVVGTCVGAAVVAGVGKLIKPTAGACAGAAVVQGGGRVRVPAAGACVGLAVLAGATSKRIGGAGTCAGAAVVLGVSGNGGLTPTKGVIIAGATVQGYGGAVPMANYLNILEGEREYG